MMLALTSGCANDEFDREIALLTRTLALKPGTVVADIGAGTGEYAIALAPVVGETGRILATELGAEEREALAATVREAGAKRVEVVAAETDATGLPPGSCDAAFLRGVYHHITEPEPFVADLFQTLRPGGRLVIVDFPTSFWLRMSMPDGIPDSRGGHGIEPALLEQELTAAGFRVLERIDPWPTHNFVTKQYAVVFERP